MTMDRAGLAEKMVSIAYPVSLVSRRNIVVVDVGCGSGRTVYQLNESGYDAYGCDLAFKKGEEGIQEDLIAKDRLRLINGPNRTTLPFADATADIILSDQVVEHVEDLDVFFREIARIAKPGSVSVHYFPSINKPIEPHVKIPLATRFQSKTWISIWQCTPFRGVPRPDWRTKGSEAMYQYLKTNTHYRSGRTIKSIADNYFGEVVWKPKVLLDAMSSRKGARIIRKIPGGLFLFNWCWSQLLVLRKPFKDRVG